MTSTADVVVIGGGVIGATVAFHLATKGAGKVVVCERRWIAAGATGKSGALVRMHYTNPHEARLARTSLPYFERWNELVGPGSSGFIRTGMLRLVAPENVGKLRANVDMLESVGVDTRVVDRAELREIVPGWHLDDVEHAAYEPSSGCADPVAVTEGFLARARDLGAEVRQQTHVEAILTDGGRVVGVRTRSEEIHAPNVVVAGGAWALPLLRSVGIDVPLQPVRIQVVLFRRGPALAGPHPVCIDGINNSWFRPEGPDWGSTLVGAAARLPLDDPDRLDESVDAEYVPAARQVLEARIPAIGRAPMRGGWAGVITMSMDGKPIIDRHPSIDGLYFFTADGGSSFKTAPAIGRTFAEWIVDGVPSTIDPRPFRASRFVEGEPIVGEHEYGDRYSDFVHASKVMVG